MENWKIAFHCNLEIFHSILASSMFHTKISVPFHSIPCPVCESSPKLYLANPLDHLPNYFILHGATKLRPNSSSWCIGRELEFRQLQAGGHALRTCVLCLESLGKKPAVWFEMLEILPGVRQSSKKQFNAANSVLVRCI